MPVFYENRLGFVLKVLIQPRSSRNIIIGLHGDALKIKLTAPPVDGAANKMCIQYLAKSLKMPRSSLAIISGQTSRKKSVLIKYKDGDDSQSERKKVKGLIESLLETGK